MRARAIPRNGRTRAFTLRARDALQLYVYLAAWCILLLTLPNALHDPRLHQVAWAAGGIGLWRYGWWTLNLARAQYFGRVRYPAMRAQADRAWAAGRRSGHVHFLMTTFHEHPETTHRCLAAVADEVRRTGAAATLWVGTGAAEDESAIAAWFARVPETPLDVRMIRQNAPGKRAAIGVTLRALSRHGVAPGDVAILMDGDSVMMPGCLQKCLSLLIAFPRLEALTTDEDALCHGPRWMQEWLTMRFAQRRLWMQSHALSDRVLTLTGRFSMLRAGRAVEEGFIRMVEADFLEHWFWGRFRFLSGDDKSTWYYLLARRAAMTFAPDALVYTIERVEGSGARRAFDNALRWSGNMLRNGARAIRLGPRVVPPYIWWCLIDQRIAIWSTLGGLLTALSVMRFLNPHFIYTYLLWIMLTRLLLSCALFHYAGRIHMAFPFLLYLNQLALAFVKGYLSFRLPYQRWANRLDQRSGQDLINRRENRIFALYLNVFYAVALALAVLLLLGVVKCPDIRQLL